MTFKELGISDPILKALADEGYERPTPIQEQSIPILLSGKDLLGCAQTGTGKTAAFAIPIIQGLANSIGDNQGRRKVRALIVTPTRELAIQIGDSFTKYAKYTNVRNTVIFGGVKQGSQTNALKRGVDVIVATPGRLLDLIGQGYIKLGNLEYSVLDEADHMLDMGFIHDIKKIVALLPADRQSLFFSATMPPDIVKLSQKILGNPEKVTVEPEQKTAERVVQGLFHVRKKEKIQLLLHLLETTDIESLLVFSRTKHGADKIVRLLRKKNWEADAIHGNKSQNARQRALKRFKERTVKILVATDIAARGIDVSQLSHVINYNIPNVPETYVHRIGRTGRARAEGVAWTFCDVEEWSQLKDIHKLLKNTIPVIEDHPFPVRDEQGNVMGTPDLTARGGRQGQGNKSRSKKSRPNNRGSKPQNRDGNKTEGSGNSPAKKKKKWHYRK